MLLRAGTTIPGDKRDANKRETGGKQRTARDREEGETGGEGQVATDSKFPSPEPTLQ